MVSYYLKRIKRKGAEEEKSFYIFLITPSQKDEKALAVFLDDAKKGLFFHLDWTMTYFAHDFTHDSQGFWLALCALFFEKIENMVYFSFATVPSGSLLTSSNPSYARLELYCHKAFSYAVSALDATPTILHCDILFVFGMMYSMAFLVMVFPFLYI